MGISCEPEEITVEDYEEEMRVSQEVGACCECGYAIPIGETYEHRSWTGSTFTTCARCSDLYAAFVEGLGYTRTDENNLFGALSSYYFDEFYDDDKGTTDGFAEKCDDRAEAVQEKHRTWRPDGATNREGEE